MEGVALRRDLFGIRRETPVGIAPVLLLVVVVAVYLALTAHARPWLLSLTLIATFTAGFVALSSSSRRAPRARAA